MSGEECEAFFEADLFAFLSQEENIWIRKQ